MGEGQVQDCGKCGRASPPPPPPASSPESFPLRESQCCISDMCDLRPLWYRGPQDRRLGRQTHRPPGASGQRLQGRKGPREGPA